MLPVKGLRLVAWRIDDEGSELPELFLKAGVAVIPVRAELLNRKPVSERLARGYPWES